MPDPITGPVTAPIPSQVAETLTKAADLIRDDGWTQEVFHDDSGCHCVRGAIAAAAGHHVRSIPYINIGRVEDTSDWWINPNAEAEARTERAELALARFLNEPTTFLVAWNDAPDQTFDRVVDTLRAAAAAVAEGAQ